MSETPARESLKPYQGTVSSTFSEEITEEGLRLFCQAVGAEASLVAPPTYLTVFRAGEFELFDRMGLKLQNVLHGEQRYVYETELRAGDRVEFQTTLTSVLEKRGNSGGMSFLSFDTEVRVSRPLPKRVGISKTTIIVRDLKGQA